MRTDEFYTSLDECRAGMRRHLSYRLEFTYQWRGKIAVAALVAVMFIAMALGLR